MRKISLTLTAIVALTLSGTVQAATQIVTGSGLVGATGVMINGSTYDVQIVDGTCAALFNGCDDLSDFTFQTQVDARAAAQALLDQVFLDTPQIGVDTDYQRTDGCSFDFFGGNACFAMVPYATANGQFTAVSARNSSDEFIGDNTDEVFSGSVDLDTFPLLTRVFVRFTPSAAAVPEPNTWAMMLLGFGAIGFTIRRKQEGRRSIA